MIIDNVLCLKETIKDYPNVCIIAAVKYTNELGALEVYEAGITNLGVNRVDDFLVKYEYLKDKNITWHFIGTLQTRKVVKCINKIDFLHSLDNLKLAREIEKHAVKKIKCFIEVNISEEETKQGIHILEVKSFLESIKELEHIEIIGLMTMAPLTKDKLIIRSVFNKLKNLQESLKKQYPKIVSLSMGMSNDYLIALDSGADYIRIGSMLFKEDYLC